MQAVSFATNRTLQMRIEYLLAVAAVVALGYLHAPEDAIVLGAQLSKVSESESSHPLSFDPRCKSGRDGGFLTESFLQVKTAIAYKSPRSFRKCKLVIIKDIEKTNLRGEAKLVPPRGYQKANLLSIRRKFLCRMRGDLLGMMWRLQPGALQPGHPFPRGH